MDPIHSSPVDLASCTAHVAAFGTEEVMIVCRSSRLRAIVGFVWGRKINDDPKRDKEANRFHVSGSYVVPWARLQGVRTWLNGKIFESFGVERITSGAATIEGGFGFMSASGYRQPGAMGPWTLTRDDYERHRAEKVEPCSA